MINIPSTSLRGKYCLSIAGRVWKPSITCQPKPRCFPFHCCTSQPCSSCFGHWLPACVWLAAAVCPIEAGRGGVGQAVIHEVCGCCGCRAPCITSLCTVLSFPGCSATPRSCLGEDEGITAGLRTGKHICSQGSGLMREGWEQAFKWADRMNPNVCVELCRMPWIRVPQDGNPRAGCWALREAQP